jgi:hypothetical protein
MKPRGAVRAATVDLTLLLQQPALARRVCNRLERQVQSKRDLPKAEAETILEIVKTARLLIPAGREDLGRGRLLIFGDILKISAALAGVELDESRD